MVVLPTMLVRGNEHTEKEALPMRELPVAIPFEQIDTFCRRWRISELAVFGSTLRDDFARESDVDVLVAFEPDADWSLLDHQQMQEELSRIIGREVDLVSKRAVERSENWIRRKAILGGAEVVYATG